MLFGGPWQGFGQPTPFVLAVPASPALVGVEGIDIAHLKGGETVGSKVCFVDGRPLKNEYRRYRIRSSTDDDYASIREVVSRRYRDAGQGQELYPDLIVIDLDLDDNRSEDALARTIDLVVATGAFSKAAADLEIGQPTDDLPVDLLGKGIPLVERAEPRLHVADGHALIVGGESGDHRRGRVSLDEHDVRGDLLQEGGELPEGP